MNDSKLVVLGANPAWQRVVSASSVALGEVVRVHRLAECPAGKGFNCAQAIHELGGTPILIGGCGSGSGPLDGSWESACRENGVETMSFPLEGPVRLALTLVDETLGASTEIVEAGPPASPGSETLLALLLANQLAHGIPLVVCGSFPAGIDPQCVLDAWLTHPVELLVDSLPMARVLALPDDHPRVIVKLNLAEWMALFGNLPVDELLAKAQEIWKGTEVVATLGKDGCVARRRDGTSVHRHPSPLSTERPLYPIGAGDAFTAALALSMGRKERLEKGLMEGLAVARASCLNPLPSRFHPQDLHQVRQDLHEPIDLT